MEKAAEIEVAKETFDFLEAKAWIKVSQESATYICISEFVKICSVSAFTKHCKPTRPVEVQLPAKEYFLPPLTHFMLLQGFVPHHIWSRNSSKSKTHDKKKDL